MAHDYYVLYDAKTLAGYSISGSPFIDIRDGQLVCKIKEDDGEALLTHKKHLQDYLIKSNGEYAELIFKNSDLWHKKKTVSNNVVKDLNYRITFFSCLGIKFEVTDKLRLFFNIQEIDAEYQTNFLNLVTENNSDATIYVTAYGDISKLLYKFDINLLKLNRNKVIELDFNTKDISLWAVRK